jgi:hypothetical protein
MGSIDFSRLNPGVLWTLLKKPYWLQILTSRQAAWPSRAEVADWKRNIPSIRDDGAHFDASPFYFEWWYFDAILRGELAVSVILRLTDTLKPASKEGSVNVSVCEKDTPALRRFIPFVTKYIHASTEICDVSIGKNLCNMKNGDYKVSIDVPDIRAELTFESATVAWRPGNGKFRFGYENTFFAWVVPQPRARVKGWVVIRGQEKAVDGVGYHDHNWGTVSLLDTVKEWSWGRLHLGDYSLIFADIRLSPRYGAGRVLPFSLIQGDEVLISSFLQSNQPRDDDADFLGNPRSVYFPKGWHLQWQESDNDLDVDLETTTVLEKADLLSGNCLRQKIIENLIAHPYYIRCSVTAKGKWGKGDHVTALEGHGIYEQMSLGR